MESSFIKGTYTYSIGEYNFYLKKSTTRWRLLKPPAFLFFQPIRCPLLKALTESERLKTKILDVVPPGGQFMLNRTFFLLPIDKSPIPFSPLPWYSSYGTQGTTHNCVVAYMAPKVNSDSGLWFDSICSVNRPSICEANWICLLNHQIRVCWEYFK